MTTDDDAIGTALTARSSTDRESDALARAQGFIERHDFAVQRRSTPLILEVCAGLGIAVVAISVLVIIARNSAHPVKPAAISSTTATAAATSTPAVSIPATGPDSATALAKDHWTQLPTAPIAGRAYGAAVWDGQEMLVWGGSAGSQQAQLMSDGASYDPGTSRWTVLPPSPLSPRVDMAYVWTGQYLFIWGGYDVAGTGHAAGDGALYDPRTQSWRSLPSAPLPATANAQAVWTGSEVVVISGPTGSAGGLNSAAAAYVPATNAWHRLPPIPTPSNANMELLTAAVAAGPDVYVWEEWEHLQQNGNETTGTGGLDLVAYDEAANMWHTQSTTGAGPLARVAQALWTGVDILVPATEQCGLGASCPVPNGLNGFSWNPHTTAWTAIPHGPVDDLNATSLWTGAALLDFNSSTSGGPDNSVPGEAAAWDPASDAWTRLPDAPYAGNGVSAVWTGDRLLMLPATESVGLQFGP